MANYFFRPNVAKNTVIIKGFFNVLLVFFSFSYTFHVVTLLFSLQRQSVQNIQSVNKLPRTFCQAFLTGWPELF